MRCLYREKKYVCGDYLEVNIYPVFKYQNSRRKKAKPTSEVQKKLNQHNAENNLIRILNANFTKRDLRFDLTYKPEHLPETNEQAQKELQNFLRRLKRYRKTHNLPPLKYVAVSERGSRSGRYHHHLVINGGVEMSELTRLWGKGYTAIKPLQFDSVGLVGIAKYLTKEPLGNRWSTSKNLIHPQPKIRDGRISQKKAKELYTMIDDRKEFERLYDGYFFAEATPFYNDYNGGVYLTVRMYKNEKAKKWKKSGGNNGKKKRGKP